MIGYIDNTTLGPIDINGHIVPVGQSVIFYNELVFDADNYSQVFNLLDDGDIIFKDEDENNIPINDAKNQFTETFNTITGISNFADNTYNQAVGIVVIDIISAYNLDNNATQSDIAQTNDLLSSLRLGLKSQAIQFSIDLHDFYTQDFKNKVGGFIESGFRGSTSSIASTNTFVRGFQSIMMGVSTAVTQYPIALDTPLQIEFGVAQTSEYCNLNADGSIEALKDGKLFMDLRLQFGRTTNSGEVDCYFNVLINGTPVAHSKYVEIDGLRDCLPIAECLDIQLSQGDTVTFEITRDSVGANDGGLRMFVPQLAGRPPAPTASIEISIFK